MNINLICLLETRVKENKCRPIVDKFFNGWQFSHNYSLAYNGRIWFLSRGQMQVDLVTATSQSISCKVKFDSQMFLLSSIYGLNEGAERKSLWNHLASVAESFPSIPWILAKDFNVISQPIESSKFDGSQGANADIKEFQECIHQVAIFDHVSSGPLFTWSNKQQENYLAKKLDKVMINEAWLSCFPSSKVEFLSPGISDHCPAFIQLLVPDVSPPKPFKFFNFWTHHPEFIEIVKASWQQPVDGKPIVVLHKKLKRFKPILKSFNKNHFAEISNKVKEKKRELEETQMTILNGISSTELVQREQHLSKELHDLLKVEESFFR